jgi:hypothetical protein
LWSFSEVSEESLGSLEFSIHRFGHVVDLIKGSIHHLLGTVDESLSSELTLVESEVGALEYSSWKSLGILDGVASISNGTGLAPRALGIISIACSFRGVQFAISLIVLYFTKL